MDLQPTLLGPNLTLRPLDESDFEGLHAVASDPLIWEQHPEPDRYKRKVFSEYFQSGMVSRGALVVIDRHSNQMIGCSRYYGLSREQSEVSVGYTFLDRKHWGGTTNKELKALMLTHAFQSVNTVIFHIGEANHRSRRAVEKLGAVLREQTRKVGPKGVLVIVTYALEKLAYK